jgi:hypothetical protein
LFGAGFGVGLRDVVVVLGGSGEDWSGSHVGLIEELVGAAVACAEIGFVLVEADGIGCGEGVGESRSSVELTAYLLVEGNYFLGIEGLRF